jgi:hypothetical protein
MSSALAQKRLLRQPFVYILCPAALTLGVLYLQVSEQLFNLFGLGDSAFSEVSNIVGFLIALVAAGIGIIAVIFLSARWIFMRRVSRRGIIAASYSVLVMVATPMGVVLHTSLEQITERRLSARGEPLIDAIVAFSNDHGRPPKSFTELIPNYIKEMPGTSLHDYPTFEIQACADGLDECFGDRWLLYADARQAKIFMRGFGGCDRYIFAPSGQYPSHDTDTICHYRAAAAGWEYEYGD